MLTDASDNERKGIEILWFRRSDGWVLPKGINCADIAELHNDGCFIEAETILKTIRDLMLAGF